LSRIHRAALGSGPKSLSDWCRVRQWPARLKRYAGGNLDIDQAIVDLHDRSYRRSRLGPPLDFGSLWKSEPGLSAREYVLAMEDDRVVGYCEWLEMSAVSGLKRCM
jgi:hypothetical protein